MEMALLIIILLVVAGYYLLPYLLRWFMRRQVNRFVDRMTGGAASQARKQQKNAGKRPETGRRKPRRKGRIIPPEYAVDVEYTETHNYSENIEISPGPKTAGQQMKEEEQVSDAEWVEMK